MEMAINFIADAPVPSPANSWVPAQNGTGLRRTHSSVSDQSSASSSDIFVAPAPATLPGQSLERLHAPVWLPMKSKRVTARVLDQRLLIVKCDAQAAKDLRQRLDDSNRLSLDASVVPRTIDSTTKSEVDGKSAMSPLVDEEDGPNHRGTYSRRYVLQHPEIQWVHRGQGRYLPASQAKPVEGGESKLKSKLRGDSHSASDDIASTRSAVGQGTLTRTSTINKTSPGADLDADERIPSLRRRTSGAQTNAATEQRSTRLGRRAKGEAQSDNDRRSSRVSNRQNYAEEDEGDDMATDKDPTFSREYVEAHPTEKFYHTGNGWYKRGERPRGHKSAKDRDSQGHAVSRRRDGSFHFDRNKTIHVSQLENYPGVEFHHCGNGWYRPGPDATGHRTSTVYGRTTSEEENEEDEGDEEDEVEEEEWDEGDDDPDFTVSKEVVLAHPEIEWVHRGNGRYKRKSAVPSAAASDSLEPGRDMTIYSKAYVLAHPNEEFHHRGNARYMRGPPPDHWATIRRRRSAGNNPPATQEDDGVLYSKAYVDSHPELEFHHRGQGRYARGPRPKINIILADEGEDNDVDIDGLVDTDYVNAHPSDTFHHRGQGRWARGMPPAGSSNKVAIRGPGARDVRDAANLLVDEEDGERMPALTALVLRAEGPDRWPGIPWHYRGGGKWGRLTKHEYEELQRRGTSRKSRGRTKVRSTDGPEAQLERETAAAEAAGYDNDDDMEMDGRTLLGAQQFKRRRLNQRGSYRMQDDGGLLTKQPSTKSQSKAPTPRPRIMDASEDVLTEEDLPQLYRDNWSPVSENIDDQADRLMRQQFRPLNASERFVKGLSKHDPATRPTENLLRLAANAQRALDQLQTEYLRLDRITAPHARIPRKLARGGRLPAEPAIFEDKKEADLYDYSYDPRRLGYQNPDTQKIQRDAEGRELRNRRNRSGLTANGTIKGWNFGDDDLERLGTRKRSVKPVNRFDGIVEAPRKSMYRGQNLTATNSGCFSSNAASMTPDDRGVTPLGGPIAAGYPMATSGRWANHVPKRIRELRGDSVGGASVQSEQSPARKGRPPGSKNLHKRKDAGIKKGPRKPKESGVVSSIEIEGGGERM